MIHGTREFFELDDFLKARKETQNFVQEIVSNLREGMTEPDCIKLIDESLKEMGVKKKWHPTKFRIGADTLKSFSEKSESFPPLTSGEIFYIDIGPVWDKYEGDYGQTFIFNNTESEFSELAAKAKQVFQFTESLWREKSLDGVELYQEAAGYAESIGVILNTQMGGHRLGDFPHHLFYRGELNETPEVPCDKLWVLEILIKDEKLQRGAFFEDILSKEDIKLDRN
ncbi:MAG: (Fe-S)-binding protein [Halobacteriovoraceae bacterium]|nr:(Fe-S)-binding protein [Halobacteriovoraceae bacterium]|tara:strand:+ start:1233 stop:1910 length:678 start_codon:yes stop_codon:yes gene_type:complete